jgi:hypothetical protein
MVDRAAYYWGTFIDSRINATKRVPAPPYRNERPTIEVPKYTPAEIRAMIYGEEETGSGQHNVVAQPSGDMDPYAVEPEPDRIPDKYRNQGQVIQDLIRMKP